MERNRVLEYFGGDELATDVWIDKYRLDNEDTPDDTIQRIAKEFYRIESHYPNGLSYEVIYNYLKDFKYIIPAGSPLNGIGNNKTLTSLSNCYVIDSPVDSYAGILKTDEELVQLMKRRGGVGIDISTLRPQGAPVNNAAVASTGAVSFMERYSNTTKEVAQGGRRGALIITMDVDHPDINKFIVAKDDLSKINGANISVKITDKFMMNIFYDTQTSNTWKKIIHQAWKSAEPGVLFWDKIISESPADCYHGFKTISVNPCGELTLCAYDSCRLMHINTYAFVDDPFTEYASFNFSKYNKTVYDAQRLMDDMIDLEREKIDAIIKKVHNRDPEDTELKKREIKLWMNIREKLMNGRRTGLNPWLGLADTLAALGIKYDSDEAIAFAERIAIEGAIHTYESSIVLATERGAFPIWSLEKEKNNPYLNRIMNHIWEECSDYDLVNDYHHYGRRNISCLTIPPSGSVAILARVSSGIEPVFNLTYERKRRISKEIPGKSFKGDEGDWWERYTVKHPAFRSYEDISGRLQQSYISNPFLGATANEINPIQKVRLQASMQQWIDHSISITHNLPENTTEDEINDIYMTAWELGCKGVTVYRENSRQGILSNKKQTAFAYHDAPKRPKVLPHDVYSIMSKGKHWIVCVGMLDSKPYEIFAFNNVEVNGSKFQGEITKLAKGRYDLSIPSINKTYNNITEGSSDEENLLTRMISTSLRHGADIRFVVDQLNKSTGDITSFGKGIARVLNRYVKELNNKKELVCPECSNKLTVEGGCEVCNNCGYSRCS